ncbi:MAG: PAS domain S-box protein [Sphingobium sp.]|nr:PAS domain S-box protein [Sphingobium sp.]
MQDPDGIYVSRAVDRAALFEGLAASAMDAIIAVDAQFNVIAFNPAAERMFGIEADAVLGTPLDRFIPERYRQSHPRHVERFTHTGETHRRMGALGAVRAVRADGEEFNVEAAISQSFVDGQRVSFATLREVREADANPQTQLLAREVDHRARNILAIVSSLISLTSAPSQADYAKALAGRVAALSRANALLSIERWKGASLNALARGELAATGAARKFSASGPDALLAARSVQPLGMLLHELCSNAMRHGALTEPGGKVAVRWAVEPNGELFLSWREEGGRPIVQPNHAGLGLTLIQQIVEGQLGGKRSLDWQSDGLHLEARFPAAVLEYLAGERDEQAPGPAAETDSEAANTAEKPSSGTLLIVEDEPILAMQLSRALDGFGWNVMGVAGSIEAANRLLADNPRPDVAILDVDLGGVPVFPFARALRHSGIPFLFCTGFEDVAYNREFSDCKVVRKPATVLQIVAALRQTVHDAGLNPR